MAENGFQPQLALSSYNNQSLFSDHYLDEILRRDRRWQQVIQPAAQFLAWLRDLYAREKDQLPHYNEDQLEDKWFKPIFERLGHADWEGQAVIPGWQGKIKKPDFVFFPDEVSRKTAVSQQNTTDYAKSALTVVEVKQWEVNLSKKTGNQPTFADQNPMYQIDTYLTLTGLEWGVLSNGRFWRLLHKNSSRTLETYFEIDLLAVLTHPDDGFATAVAAYFWLFFSDTAFRPEPQGHTFLQEALDQSRAYALALEADLRDNAYRALEQLIIGFFAGDGRLDAHNPADRTLVYQNSLYLLYRLLFIFYGESRALLPVLHPLYREQYALQQLTKKIDRRRNELDRLPTTGQIYWQQLQQLFRLISGGDAQLNADLGVPRYNGGLFDPEQHPFLEVHFVGDRALARAVDYLATRRIMVAGGKPAYQSVDYRTLDVRQLGSIYEGLLEYRVAIADEELVTITKKKVETWVPAAKKGKAKSYGETRQPGDLYLTTDKGERKATGSYYTPDYIVEYIVENTLGPVVAQVRERVKAAIKRAHLRDAATRQQRSADLFIAEILALNVLDPAMGSGHFLVEATSYLARVLATDEYTQVTGPSEGPVTSNGETDLLYWKRRVVEACIYGVDKNPMAVELAKLSLWLKTAAADKPLSFLDHHLQHGDSLIGTWLDDLERAPGARGRGQGAEGQESLFDEGALTRDVGLAVKGVATIERLPTLDIETVHAKEAAWRDIQQTHMDRWRRLADLWVSAYFGNEISAEEYRALAARLQGQDSLLSDTQAERFLTHPAVTDNDYFHWQLAFPEVFFDENGNSRKDAAGFDAVIGNPPYVRQEQLTPFKPFLKDDFASYHGVADLYLYFYEQGVRLLGMNQQMAYISSGTFAHANFASSFREWLPRNARIEKLIDFGENQPFIGAEMARPSILILKKGNQNEIFRVLLIEDTTIPESLDEAEKIHGYYCATSILKQNEWSFTPVSHTRLFDKIMSIGQPLEEVAKDHIYYGIKPGFSEAFILNSSVREKLIKSNQNCSDLLKPMLRGADLRPWYLENEGHWLLRIPNGWTVENFGNDLNEQEAWAKLKQTYPNIAEYLLPFTEKGKKRYDKGQFWWELRACDYYEEFKKPKILWCEISKLPRFVWDESSWYINNAGYFISRAKPEWLGILQSRVTWFSISKICQPFRLRAGLWQYKLYIQYVKRLRIPKMDDDQQRSIGHLAISITDKAKTRYQLHEQIRHRILTDLGLEDCKLNNALTAWWSLDFPTFRAQIKKVFKRDIPLMERDDWELYLADARQKHEQLTAQIIALETELNQHVYALFDLTPEEIQIIEESTKYKYGEV